MTWPPCRINALGLALGLALSGCAALPERTPDDAYFPPPRGRWTVPVGETIYRAAHAAGDDPRLYSFAFVQSPELVVLNGEDAILYVSEGVAALPERERTALIAVAVARQALGHAGQRRKLSLGLATGFTALGLAVPGLGLADVVLNPLVVRAFSREHVLAADRRAADILAAMGEPRPRRALVEALVATRAGSPGGLLDHEPTLDARLEGLEPLEPLPRAHRAP